MKLVELGILHNDTPIPHPFDKEIKYMKEKGWNTLAEYVESMSNTSKFLHWFNNVGITWSVGKIPFKVT